MRIVGLIAAVLLTAGDAKAEPTRYVVDTFIRVHTYVGGKDTSSIEYRAEPAGIAIPIQNAIWRCYQPPATIAPFEGTMTVGFEVQCSDGRSKVSAGVHCSTEKPGTTDLSSVMIAVGEVSYLFIPRCVTSDRNPVAK